MGNGSTATPSFNLSDPPTDPVQLQRWLRGMVVQLQASIALLERKNFPTLHKAPAKPRDGDPAIADGVDWNPGGGKGFYIYGGGVWTLIKAIP